MRGYGEGAQGGSVISSLRRSDTDEVRHERAGRFFGLAGEDHPRGMGVSDLQELFPEGAPGCLIFRVLIEPITEGLDALWHAPRLAPLKRVELNLRGVGDRLTEAPSVRWAKMKSIPGLPSTRIEGLIGDLAQLSESPFHRTYDRVS